MIYILAAPAAAAAKTEKKEEKKKEESEEEDDDMGFGKPDTSKCISLLSVCVMIDFIFQVFSTKGITFRFCTVPILCVPASMQIHRGPYEIFVVLIITFFHWSRSWSHCSTVLSTFFLEKASHAMTRCCHNCPCSYKGY